MANSRFTNVYNILKDVNFDIENAIGSDVICTICNKILINAHYAPCGCRYCLECITAYLDGEDKCCPGNTDDCKIDLLNINNNIHIDHPMNMKISRLKVKCPEGQCNEMVELRKLEDHIRVCNWRPTDCPFFNVGCRNVQMRNDKMEQQILSENHVHTKLLMDCIDILRNEFGQMKEEMRDMREEVREMNEVKAEVREMREEVKVKQIVIDELGAVIAEQTREIDLLGGEIVALGNVNRRMKAQINGLGTKMESYEAPNSEMRNDEESQMTEMTAQMNEKLEQMELKGSNIDVKIGGLEERVIAMAAQQNQLNYGEFVWPIDNFANKRQKAQNGTETKICSDLFFTHKNGYQMCLDVWPNGFRDCKGTHLSVFIHLMRGPFDDVLQWPFKCDVTISLVNQQSGLNHISMILKYDDLPYKSTYEKPITDRNKLNGFPKFIELNELMSDISLYSNDRIFIKCSVQIS